MGRLNFSDTNYDFSKNSVPFFFFNLVFLIFFFNNLFASVLLSIVVGEKIITEVLPVHSAICCEWVF